MKILLINPLQRNKIESEIPEIVSQEVGSFPPLGLMYLEAYLKKHTNYDVHTLDTLAEGIDYLTIEERIRGGQPTVVGITAHTHNLIDVTLTTKIVKKIDKNIHVCLGGPHVNAFPDESIQMAEIDSVVLGEGEITFAELVKTIGKGKDLSRIKGIKFKEHGKIITTAPRESIIDLNSLPFPRREALDIKKYYYVAGKGAAWTTIITSRGCPYRCIFCSTPKGGYRVRSASNIVDEMEECANLGIKEIHFVDDTFNVYPQRVMEMCQEILERKLSIEWGCRARIDTISREMLKKAKEAGLSRIQLGVETGSDIGLQILKKGITIAQVRQVFKWTRELGIETVAYFMIGCPHEKNKEDVYRTIRFAKELDPDFVVFNILTPYPATELYAQGLKRGILDRDCWREFALTPNKDFIPPVWEEHLTREELFALLNSTYRRFYLRPKVIFRNLFTLHSVKELKQKARAGLALFRLPH